MSFVDTYLKDPDATTPIFYKKPVEKHGIVRVICGDRIMRGEGPVWHVRTEPFQSTQGRGFEVQVFSIRDLETGLPLSFGFINKGKQSFQGISEQGPIEKMVSWQQRRNMVMVGAAILYFLYATAVIITGDVFAGLPVWVASCFLTAVVTAGIVSLKVLRNASYSYELCLVCRCPDVCKGTHFGIAYNSVTYPAHEQAADLGLHFPEKIHEYLAQVFHAAHIEEVRTLTEQKAILMATLEEHRTGGRHVQLVSNPDELGHTQGPQMNPLAIIVVTFIVTALVAIAVWWYSSEPPDSSGF